MLIAQFSDTHIKPEGQLAYSVVDTHQMLSQAIDHLLQLPQQPDVVIISGDLVDAGSVVEYQRLAALFSVCPCLYSWCPATMMIANTCAWFFETIRALKPLVFGNSPYSLTRGRFAS